MRTTTPCGCRLRFSRSEWWWGGFFLPVIGVVRMSLSQYRCYSVGSSQTTFPNYLQVFSCRIIIVVHIETPLSMIGSATFDGIWSASILTLPNLYARVALCIVPVVMLYNIEATVISISVLL